MNLALPTISKGIKTSKVVSKDFITPPCAIRLPCRTLQQNAVLDAPSCSQFFIKLRVRSFDVANIEKSSEDTACENEVEVSANIDDDAL